MRLSAAAIPGKPEKEESIRKGAAMLTADWKRDGIGDG